MDTVSKSDVELGHAESIPLPEANYGREVQAMEAVLSQLRGLIGNLEGLLFNMRLYSHKPPAPKPESAVVMDDGDFIEVQPTRLIRGYGVCKPKELDVHPTAEKSKTATPSS